MAIFKCKMCGGTIEFSEGATVGVCDSCGTKQTLPRLDDDRRANLYDRANHFRRNNEFDKAAAIYEQILTEDTTDAESYWSLVLCRYGIEYIEDPATRKRVPTVNRAQFTSIFDDDNYKSALQYADGYQYELYEKEAKAINDIQKGILAISQKEEPFDVFICYKETDNNGRRTPDSVLANDLYYQLKQEGFKVFFARITLEDKLGSAYEPYIFAALNSSKVMVVLGTKPEHFNAVWVKNEWNRYLALVKQSGGKKILIPAYRDMDPYDLPEEFSHLQAQDMSKLGFMQDLIRGIKKVCGDTIIVVDQNADTKESVSLSTNDYEKQIQFGKSLLKQKKWAKSRKCFLNALRINADGFEANLGLLFSKVKISSFSEKPAIDNVSKLREYINTVETADDTDKNQLILWANETEIYFEELRIKKQNKQNRVAKIASILLLVLFIAVFLVFPTFKYANCKYQLKQGKVKETVEGFYSSKFIGFIYLTNKLFKDYGDSFFEKGDYINAYNCYKYLAEKDHNKRLYSVGCKLLDKRDYKMAAECFLQIYDYKDSNDYYNYCKGREFLLKNSTNAYNYLAKCKNFLDTKEIFNNTTWLNSLERMQGEWYTKKKQYGSHLEYIGGEIGFSSAVGYYDKRFYIEIEGISFADMEDEYGVRAEKVNQIETSNDKLIINDEDKQIILNLESDTKLIIDGVLYEKDD